jgi:hypothetical protein
MSPVCATSPDRSPKQDPAIKAAANAELGVTVTNWS